MFNQAFATPSAAAAEVLRLHWDHQLPIRVDSIASQMGVLLLPQANMGWSGHYFSADDQTNPYRRPVIAFNLSDSAPRQRFTVAHELGHHVLGHGTSPRDTSMVFSSWGGNWKERAANQFAAEVLMPAETVRLALSRGYESVDALATLFGVSSQAMGYRMINLGLST